MLGLLATGLLLMWQLAAVTHATECGLDGHEHEHEGELESVHCPFAVVDDDELIPAAAAAHELVSAPALPVRRLLTQHLISVRPPCPPATGPPAIQA